MATRLPIETVQAPRVASASVDLTTLTPAEAVEFMGLPPGAVITRVAGTVVTVSDDTAASPTLTMTIDGVAHDLIAAQDVKAAAGAITVVPYEGGPITEADSISITFAGNGDGAAGEVFLEVEYIIDGRADEVYG